MLVVYSLEGFCTVLGVPGTLDSPPPSIPVRSEWLLRTELIADPSKLLLTESFKSSLGAVELPLEATEDSLFTTSPVKLLLGEFFLLAAGDDSLLIADTGVPRFNLLFTLLKSGVGRLELAWKLTN